MINKFWTISLFGVVFSTFLIVGYFLYQDIDDTSDKRTWENHTAEVQSKIREIVELNFEQGVQFRSYFLHHDPTFRKQYESTSQRINQRLENLEFLVSDNPSQLKSTKELESLFLQKNELHERVFSTLKLQEKMGREESKKTLFLALDHCDKYMSQIKRTGKIMNAEENVLLTRRKEEFNDQVVQSKRSALYLTSALLLVLILALLFILKSFNAMSKARNMVEQQNSVLKTIRSDLETRNAELNLLSEKFESSLFHSKVAAFDWNDTSKENFWISSSMFTMLEMEEQDFSATISGFFGKHMHQDDSAAVRETLTSHLINGTPYNPEYRLKKKDGSYRHFRAIGDTSWVNGVQRMTGVIINIDKEIVLRETRETINAKLLEYSLRFDLVLKSSSYGVWDWFDVSEPEQWWSDTFYDLVGFKANDFPSNADSFKQLVHPDDYDLTQKAIKKCVQKGNKINVEYRMKTKERGFIWFRAVGDHVLDENNPSKIRIIGVVSDISKEKLFSEELKRSNADLHDFAYVASHDLQEPLRKIQAFGDRLKIICEKEENNFAGLPMVEKMNDSASRMRGLIDDLLNYSRVSAESNFVDKVNLSELILDVKDFLSVTIETEKAQFVIQADLPVLYGVNKSNIFQLFQNLISNALKFHKSDESPIIKISYEILNTAEAVAIAPFLNNYKQYYRFEVKDNGIGFDERYMEKIFTIFQRLNGRSEYKGTGIGLAVCQKLCENHGGTIGANAKVGKGASFYIILPLKESF